MAWIPECAGAATDLNPRPLRSRLDSEVSRETSAGWVKSLKTQVQAWRASDSKPGSQHGRHHRAARSLAPPARHRILALLFAGKNASQNPLGA